MGGPMLQRRVGVPHEPPRLLYAARPCSNLTYAASASRPAVCMASALSRTTRHRTVVGQFELLRLFAPSPILNFVHHEDDHPDGNADQGYCDIRVQDGLNGDGHVAHFRS